MKRKLFTLCAAASLLLGVAAYVLWVRSYSRADGLGYARPEDRVFLGVSTHSSSVAFHARWGSRLTFPPAVPRWRYTSWPVQPGARWDDLVVPKIAKWRFAWFL